MKKIPWISTEERKRMEILYRDAQRMAVFYPERAKLYEQHMKHIQQELDFDK